MTDTDILQAKINYFCREKYFQSMQNAATEAMKKYTGDAVYKFYYGLSLALEGRLQESIRELDDLQNNSEVCLGTILTLIYAHRKFKSTDKEAVARLDSKLKEMRKKADDKALYYAGVFLFHTGRYDKAREYVDRMLKLKQSSKEGYVIKGWVEMMAGKELRDNKAKNALQYFESALNAANNQKDVDALFGKAKFYELKNNFSASLEQINQIIAMLPNFLPALIEKMKMLLALHDWEQALDMTHRLLNIDSHCIEAMRFNILYMITREGNYDEIVIKLSELWNELTLYEPQNADLFFQTGQLYSRLCGCHSGILQQTFKMVERAAELDERNSDYVTELGYQCLLQKKLRDSLKHYKHATKLDGTSIGALTGIISCQLLEKQYDSAEQQLDFLREVQMSIGPSAELLYLHAVLARVKHKGSDEIMQLLDESFHAHCSLFKALPLGINYFLLLNPDFLLLLVKEYLHFLPTVPLNPGQPTPPALKQCLLILEPVTKACPGMLESLFLMAKIKYLTGDLKAATATLQHIIDNVSVTFSEAYLLMAQIQLHQQTYQQASHFLEVGLSYNFEVRDHPLYHLIKAQVHKKQGELDDALKTLVMAMNLPGMKALGSGVPKSDGGITLTDKVSLFLELADVYRLLNKPQEATMTMENAMREFRSTPEEARVTVANADIALARGATDQALSILKSIGSDHAYYMQAKEKMAEIYLHHFKDKRKFASCYREIVEKFSQNSQALLLLGDAYMRIQEPEMAIEAYERAYKENPKDFTLSNKIGQALVKTHNYGKAINYYQEALNAEDQSCLRNELASLFLNLHQYDKAEKVLMEGLEKASSQGGGVNDASSLIAETTSYKLLAEVHKKSGNLQNSIKILLRAKEVQNRVLKRVSIEQPNLVSEQRHVASVICTSLAEHAAVQRNYEKSIEFYKEAVSFDDSNNQAMLDLAHLYMIVGDLEACQQTCTTLLKNDKANDAATVMLANLNFFKNDYDTALFHFQQLLNRKPDSYEALARLIEVMRRMGRLEDVPAYLERADQSSACVQMEPGFNYCKALFEWYTGNPNNALKLFNKARKDNEWGQRTIRNMIEICLNPDSDILGGETFDNVENATFERQDSHELAVKTAEKLLKELKSSPGDIQPILLANNVMLATRQKSLAEKVLSDLMQIASNDMYRDHVGVILGIATAHMILKQVVRARNQLKRVVKNTWNFEDAEDLERCWLLLADVYIQSGKYDMATELLRRVLQHNRSCCKAFEYIGYIMEKEQSYKDAAAHYEQAWKFSNKNNPVIGYKLAFNYMKAKRYTDAIDVCHMVLGKFPNYPKIRKEILEKSRANLKV